MILIAFLAGSRSPFSHHFAVEISHLVRYHHHFLVVKVKLLWISVPSAQRPSCGGYLVGRSTRSHWHLVKAKILRLAGSRHHLYLALTVVQAVMILLHIASLLHLLCLSVGNPPSPQKLPPSGPTLSPTSPTNTVGKPHFYVKAVGEPHCWQPHNKHPYWAHYRGEPHMIPLAHIHCCGRAPSQAGSHPVPHIE